MKMKKSEVKPFKETLLALRARLRGDVSTLANAALSKSNNSHGSGSSVPSHIADMGSDTFEQDNTILLMNNEGETLSQIESALERIEAGGLWFLHRMFWKNSKNASQCNPLHTSLRQVRQRNPILRVLIQSVQFET